MVRYLIMHTSEELRLNSACCCSRRSLHEIHTAGIYSEAFRDKIFTASSAASNFFSPLIVYREVNALYYTVAKIS